jgi:hypothetical protein
VDEYSTIFEGYEIIEQLLFGIEIDITARNIGTEKLLFIKIIVNFIISVKQP